LDSQNIYAANGIAIALAERGYVDVAKNLFIQVHIFGILFYINIL